jgi:nitrate reductase NapA
VNQDFVNKHVAFKLGNDDIGYGLRPSMRCRRRRRTPPIPAARSRSRSTSSRSFVAKYDVKTVSKLSGVAPERLERLAKLYADPRPR